MKQEDTILEENDIPMDAFGEIHLTKKPSR